MGRKILFSAVGYNDPVSKDYNDGPMLYICRNEKPEIVYLYLTQEMVKRQKLDERYSKFLDKLGEDIGHSFKYEFIKKENVTNPSLYKVMYEELEKCFQDLTREGKILPNDELLINMTSGTPAITQSLQVLHALGKIKGTLKQVDPPKTHVDSATQCATIDVDDTWKKNKEIQNSIIQDEKKVVRLRTYLEIDLTFQIQKESIISRIENYDYNAAYFSAKLVENKTKSYLKYIEAARDRHLLQYDKAFEVFKENINVNKMFPFQEKKFLKHFEYILYLQLKIKKEELTDFYRGITPIIFELSKVILLKAGIDMSELSDEGHWKKEDEIENYADKENSPLLNETLKKYLKQKAKTWGNNFVSSNDVYNLIKVSELDDKIKGCARNLRNLEKNVRNRVAHEILLINEKNFSVKFIDQKKQFKKFRVDTDKTFNLIVELFNYAYHELDNESWTVYDEMNKFIIEKIKSS